LNISPIIKRHSIGPFSGDVFIFINWPCNRIKMLRWEPGSYVLYYKRLEKGTFELPPWPQLRSAMAIDYGELAMLVNGISTRNAKKRSRFLIQNLPGK
jgi:transposase